MSYTNKIAIPDSPSVRNILAKGKTNWGAASCVIIADKATHCRDLMKLLSVFSDMGYWAVSLGGVDRRNESQRTAVGISVFLSSKSASRWSEYHLLRVLPGGNVNDTEERESSEPGMTESPNGKPIVSDVYVIEVDAKTTYFELMQVMDRLCERKGATIWLTPSIKDACQ